MGDRKSQWMSLLTRHTLEYANSYSEAKEKLSNTPMLAPAYYILGGNKTGEVSVQALNHMTYIYISLQISLYIQIFDTLIPIHVRFNHTYLNKLYNFW